MDKEALIVVTGAAGMVGRKFLERLAAEPGVLGAPVSGAVPAWPADAT